MKQNPDDFKFLFEPCARNAMAIEVVSAGQTLRDLLNLIKDTRFGFTTLADGDLF